MLVSGSNPGIDPGMPINMTILFGGIWYATRYFRNVQLKEFECSCDESYPRKLGSLT